MFIVDVGALVWMESSRIGRHRSEKSIIWIEHLPCQNLIPFPSETTSINTFLTLESDIQTSILDFLTAAETEGTERIEEHQFSSDIECDGTAWYMLSFSIVDFAIEIIALIVELEDFRIV